MTFKRTLQVSSDLELDNPLPFMTSTSRLLRAEGESLLSLKVVYVLGLGTTHSKVVNDLEPGTTLLC